MGVMSLLIPMVIEQTHRGAAYDILLSSAQGPDHRARERHQTTMSPNLVIAQLLFLES